LGPTVKNLNLLRLWVGEGDKFGVQRRPVLPKATNSKFKYAFTQVEVASTSLTRKKVSKIQSHHNQRVEPNVKQTYRLVVGSSAYPVVPVCGWRWFIRFCLGASARWTVAARATTHAEGARGKRTPLESSSVLLTKRSIIAEKKEKKQSIFQS